MTPGQAACYGLILESRDGATFAALARALKCSRSSVTRYTHALINMGLIVVTSKPSDTGCGRTCIAVPIERAPRRPRQPLNPRWAYDVAAGDREVFAAILELGQYADMTHISDMLSRKRDTVNAACKRLEACGAITMTSEYAAGHRRLVAAVAAGAEQIFRDYRLEHTRPEWQAGLSDAALEVYRIIYHSGPMRLGQIVDAPSCKWVKSTVTRVLLDLQEAGAVAWELLSNDTDHPVRWYRATQRDIGRPSGAAPTRSRTGKPWAGQPYRPPSRGRARYRNLGRGHE